MRATVVTDVIDRLQQKSGLTKVQLETLRLRKRVKIGEIGVNQAANLRKPLGVRPGSYYRVLDQARNNFERTVFTLLLGVRLQAIQVEGIRRLLNMLAEVPEEMSDASLDEFMTVLSTLVRRIVTL